ncbi:MAG: hypothetical protein A6D91_09920 [Bacillaceae bacterium G1]|nr:MAG: hypothetical protein A6D91_09920 [Bacillaceae bacterium G1]
MIDLKPEIRQALLNNAALVSLLGGQKIWPEVAPDGTPEPYVTFFELVNVDELYADDQAHGSEIHFQVDVWSKGNTGPIAVEVNKTMETLGFYRTGAVDLYEDDTKTYHKALRYKINLEKE